MSRLSLVAERIRPAVFAQLQARIDQVARGGGDPIIPLQIGDTHLAPPEAARQVLSSLDPSDMSLFRYGATSGLAPLREAMARVLERRGISDVDPASEVLVGNGGTHALYCAAASVLDPGDEIILATPYWPLAPGVFTAAGALLSEAPLTQQLFARPSIDPYDVLERARSARTRAVYFISPNNPDGKVLRAEEIARIADFARDHDLWVFADEVYSDVVFDEAARSPSIASLAGMRERTIVLHSLSKSHALAGARVGFALAPERVIAAARRVSTHTAFNVSVAMQRAAHAALLDERFPADATRIYREARDAATVALQGAPIGFHVAEGATYLFLDFAPALELRGLATTPEARRDGMIRILELAIDRGVLLAPGDAFGAGYESYARLCFTAVPSDRVTSGIERLRDAVDVFVRE